TYWQYLMSQPHDPLSFQETGTVGAGAYYAIVNGNLLQLATSAQAAMAGDAIDIDTSGSAGTAHRISAGSISFDAKGDVNGTLETLHLTNHGFANDMTVTYDDGGGTGIGPAEGTVYYVFVVDVDTIKLKTAPAGSFVDLTPTVSSESQSLT